MKKLVTLILALAIGFGLKAQCPLTQAVDFTATDVHGLCQRTLSFQAKTNGQRENKGNKSFHKRIN